MFTFLSTLPARGATYDLNEDDKRLEEISIHAPREGSDADYYKQLPVLSSISIHAPREGSDMLVPGSFFLLVRHFYPRSPRGERQQMC